jgi:hypothetical protein
MHRFGKIIAVLILFALVFSLISGKAQADDDLARRLSSQDSKIRREAAEELVTLALRKDAEAVIRTATSVLGNNASPDKSKAVVLDALKIVARETEISRRYILTRMGFDPTATAGSLKVSPPPELRALLIQLMQSQDPVLREKAIIPLVGMYPQASDVERLIITRLADEKTPEVASTLIQAFGLGGYRSQASIDALYQVLATSDVDDLRGYAAIELGHLGADPSRVLPVLFGLLKPEFSFLSGSLLNAIALYGEAASPYLERLKQFTDSVSDQNLKNQIDSTIRAIQLAGEAKKIGKRKPVKEIVGAPTAEDFAAQLARDAEARKRAR